MILGGLHYGYNIAVVGAALPSLRVSLPNLRSIEVGTLSSATLLGAVLGSPLSGVVCSLYGRRVGTIIGESCSALGALGCTLSSSVPWLAAFRMLVGLGVGFCTLAKPLYVKETVSAQEAGGVQASFAPAVAIGILVAQAAGGVLGSWRALFLLGAAPPVLLLSVGIFLMPESPSWLESRAVTSTRASPVDKTSGDSAKAYNGGGDGNGGYSCRSVQIAVCLAIANQLTGAYPVLVYSPSLVEAAAPGTSSTFIPLSTALANLVGASAAVRMMSGCRRRPLVLSALGVEAACLCYAGYLTSGVELHNYAVLALALTLGAWCLAYEVGPGGGYFVLIGDLAKPPMATTVYAIANSVRYTCEFVSSFFFLSASSAFGTQAILVFHAAVSLLTMATLAAFLPETNPRFGPSTTLI